MTLVIVRNLLSQRVDEFRTFGPGPDETHMTTQYVEDLGELVETQLANHLPRSRDTHVVLLRPLGTRGLRLLRHAPKLEELERAASQAYAHLAVEDGRAVLAPDQERDDGHDRPCKQEQHQRARDVERPRGDLS